MKEPTIDDLCTAFRRHGVEPPAEYVWLAQHRILGFDAFSQFEPWQFCGVEEVEPLSERWPATKLDRALIPFARLQGSDDLACFEFAHGRAIRICNIHYSLGPPATVEFWEEYPDVWVWLKAAISDVKLSFELKTKKAQT